MGEVLSTPDKAELECLSEMLDTYCRTAAEAIGRADVMLLCTGAGFSADSGLPTFKDIARVDAYRKCGLCYQDLCRPALLDSDPELFYGFWGSCFNAYRDTQPHGGYEILKKWRDDRFLQTELSRDIQRHVRKHRTSEVGTAAAGAFFVLTSNIDNHSVRVFEEREIRECHGSLEVWQCGAADGPCCQKAWCAPPDLRFVIDSATMRAKAAVASPNKSEKDQRHAPPAQHRQVCLLNAPHQQKKTSFLSDESWPCCPSCDHRSRPAVLMFDDVHWTQQYANEDRHAAWHTAVMNVGRHWKRRKSRFHVVILEIGCGTEVTKVRQASEDAAEDYSKMGFGVSLVRVNPEHPQIDRRLPGVQHIPLCCRGLEALQRIESLFLFEPYGRWNSWTYEGMESESTQSSSSDVSDASDVASFCHEDNDETYGIHGACTNDEVLHRVSGLKRSFSSDTSIESLLPKRSR